MVRQEQVGLQGEQNQEQDHQGRDSQDEQVQDQVRQELQGVGRDPGTLQWSGCGRRFAGSHPRWYQGVEGLDPSGDLVENYRSGEFLVVTSDCQTKKRCG